MRFHVLGVGAIGSLVAFHLKRSLRARRIQAGFPSRRELLSADLSGDPERLASAASLSVPAHVAPYLPNPLTSSVTLHIRKRPFVRHSQRKMNNSIVLERDSVRDIEGGFQVQQSSATSEIMTSVLKDHHSRFTISRANTRAAEASPNPVRDDDGGVSLISTLEGSHHPPPVAPIDSLIVATKCDSTLAALRPLASRIHPWSTIVLLHNGMGLLETLQETLFTDPAKRPNFVLATTTHGAWRKGALDTVHASFGSLHFSVVPSDRGQFETFTTIEPPFAPPTPPLRRPVGSGWERFAPVRSDQELPPPTAREVLSLAAIPDDPAVSTLRGTVATLLSLPLDVHWDPVRTFELRALRKLVINACINPLTALADCKNGDLFASPPAMDAMWSVCLEAAAVLEANFDPHPSLSPEALFRQVQRVVRLTAANWSSMHSDIKSRRGSTEIDYINGYISARARAHDIDTPANDLLTNLIKLKTARATGTGKL